MDECNPPLDVSNLTLSASPIFTPPTNEASATESYRFTNLVQNLVSTSNAAINSLNSTSSNAPSVICSDVDFSWLPAAKGDIKKLAQTRFVNSSPNSYRLMPASVESSESDKTSFVEKSSHKFLLPVSYFLEVAKLWAISNRSELECQFTLAKTDNTTQKYAEAALTENCKRRPICHVKELLQKDASTELLSMDKTIAENELLNSVKRFLKTCEKKDRMLMLNRGISDSVGSETRRYLSQIDSLMDKSFAAKLRTDFHVKSPCKESRKRSLSYTGSDYQRKRTKDSPSVNVFTVATSSCPTETEEDQFVIIHIPTALNKSANTNATKKSEKSLCRSFGGSSSTEKVYSCFYCDLVFDEQLPCAKHMLSHLTSSIQA